jgi:hypothetical protein
MPRETSVVSPYLDHHATAVMLQVGSLVGFAHCHIASCITGRNRLPVNARVTLNDVSPVSKRKHMR